MVINGCEICQILLQMSVPTMSWGHLHPHFPPPPHAGYGGQHACMEEELAAHFCGKKLHRFFVVARNYFQTLELTFRDYKYSVSIPFAFKSIDWVLYMSDDAYFWQREYKDFSE